jgi:hypothetical protein
LVGGFWGSGSWNWSRQRGLRAGWGQPGLLVRDLACLYKVSQRDELLGIAEQIGVLGHERHLLDGRHADPEAPHDGLQMLGRELLSLAMAKSDQSRQTTPR